MQILTNAVRLIQSGCIPADPATEWIVVSSAGWTLLPT